MAEGSRHYSFRNLLPKRKAALRPFWRSCAIGIAVSVAIAVGYNLGLARQFELWAIDLRFRHVGTGLRELDSIRIIAVDDQSLRQVGRWPWPRRHLADLVNVLADCGVKAIVMDLHFPEPQPVRLTSLATEAAGDDLADLIRSEPLAVETVNDDAEFAAAIEKAGNVYLPVVFEPLAGRYDLQRARKMASRLAATAQNLTDEQFARLLGIPLQVLGPDAFLRSRMANLLRGNFLLNEQQLAAALRQDPKRISKWMATVKRQVALEMAWGYMAATRNQSSLLAKIAARPSTSDEFELAQALRQARAQRLVFSTLPRAKVPAKRFLQVRNPYEVQVPVEPLAAAARGFGHVVVLRDRDGVVRRLPLLVRWRERLIPQLSLRVAADLLGLDLNRARLVGDRLVLPGRSGRTLVLQVCEDGQTVLNWVGTGKTWTGTFRPIPAGYVLEAAQLARQIRRNEKIWKLAKARLVALVQPSAYGEYISTIENLEKLKRQAESAKKRSSELRQKIDEYAAKAQQIEKQCGNLLRAEIENIRTSLEAATDPAEKRRLQEYLQVYEDVVNGALARRIERINAGLRARAAERIKELRQLLDGKVCFVGYTAAALADLASTPLWHDVPGVMAHAQLLNGLLQGRLPVLAGQPADTAAVLLCCLFVTLLTAWRGPGMSLIGVIAANLAYISFNALVLFRLSGVIVALAAPCLGMLTCWALITAYKQLAEERAKRHLAKTLQQYTSPALARRMAEDPEAIGRAEMREITCFFSDLRGFTTISESLGAERTQTLLNAYLECMTEVLDRHEAFINKFLGDGIFAFFNPAINPQPDHARRACMAALDCLEVLEALKQQVPEREPIHLLHMRIGLASGPAVVGNCGSERKFDYTCIGDTVNLASRLETANKSLGTNILVNARTKELAGAEFAFRFVGRLQVAGRAAYCETYELLGLRDELPATTLQYAEQFEEAVHLYIRSEVSAALRAFHECLAENPRDPVAQFYAEMCRQLASRGVPQRWLGTLEIAAK